METEKKLACPRGQTGGGHENPREAPVPGAASSDAGVKWLDTVLFLKQSTVRKTHAQPAALTWIKVLFHLVWIKVVQSETNQGRPLSFVLKMF